MNEPDYEATYTNGSVVVEISEPPKDAGKNDIYHILVTGGHPNPNVDIYVHENEALDIATGLLFCIRNNNIKNNITYGD